MDNEQVHENGTHESVVPAPEMLCEGLLGDIPEDAIVLVRRQYGLVVNISKHLQDEAGWIDRKTRLTYGQVVGEGLLAILKAAQGVRRPTLRRGQVVWRKATPLHMDAFIDVGKKERTVSVEKREIDGKVAFVFPRPHQPEAVRSAEYTAGSHELNR